MSFLNLKIREGDDSDYDEMFEDMEGVDDFDPMATDGLDDEFESSPEDDPNLSEENESYDEDVGIPTGKPPDESSISGYNPAHEQKFEDFSRCTNVNDEEYYKIDGGINSSTNYTYYDIEVYECETSKAVIAYSKNCIKDEYAEKSIKLRLQFVEWVINTQNKTNPFQYELNEKHSFFLSTNQQK